METANNDTFFYPQLAVFSSFRDPSIYYLTQFTPNSAMEVTGTYLQVMYSMVK